MESLLVSTGADSTVKVWDLKEGVKLMTLKGHKNVVQVVRSIKMRITLPQVMKEDM